MTFNIFFTSYFNTAINLLLAHNSFLQTKELRMENSKENILVGSFDEFNHDWYLRVGTPLIASQAAMMIAPHFLTIL